MARYVLDAERLAGLLLQGKLRSEHADVEAVVVFSAQSDEIAVGVSPGLADRVQIEEISDLTRE